MSNTSVSRVVRAALLASLTLSLAGCAWLPWKGKLWGKPDEVRAEDAQPMSVEASSADPTALAIPTDVVTASADGTAEPGKSAIRLKQFPQAVAVLTSAAEGGDAQSQYFLGRLYYSGIGVTASELDARKWLTAAGEQSNADAAYALSGVLAAGAPEDRALATDWLKRAADGGHVQAKKVLEANSLPLAPVRDAAGNAALARELMKWAIRRDDPESLATFAGIAGVDAVDEFNRTVLAYAIERGSQVSVEKLLEIGASPTHADRFGVTPLMLAAENDSPAIMERMLAGADVARIDTQDSTGNSALIYAVRVAQIENVARLLSAGADVTSLMRTAGSLWMSRRNPVTSQWGRRCGARVARAVCERPSGITQGSTRRGLECSTTAGRRLRLRRAVTMRGRWQICLQRVLVLTNRRHSVIRRCLSRRSRELPRWWRPC